MSSSLSQRSSLRPFGVGGQKQHFGVAVNLRGVAVLYPGRNTRPDEENLLLRISREFGPQHLTRVEQNHRMQTAGTRAVGRWIAKDTDAVAGFKRILRPTEALQDGRAAGDDIPFNGFTAAIGLKH
jgi:hypothetical protein